MDLLLDETICAGTVAVPREMVRLAGGVNKRLGAKQKYEAAAADRCRDAG